jgi:hemerythrin
MSPFITWKSFYSVGEPSLDAQHQQIIEMINDLFTAMQKGAEYQVIKSILDRLVQYTSNHFEYEEKIMEEADYPALPAHKKLHDNMRKRTLDLHKDLTKVTAHDLLQFLKVWWLEHIQGEDMHYAQYLPAGVAHK